MPQVQTQIKQKMFYVTPLFILLLSNITVAEELETNSDDTQICESKCGCNKIYIYDPIGDRCLINFKMVIKRVEIPYPKPHVDDLPDDSMAQQIFIEGEEIFRGIMIAVILFIVCAGLCITTACVYCCRIKYTDRRLKNDLKALATKLKWNYKSKKISKKRMPAPPEAESCSVVVEPAGIFVV